MKYKVNYHILIPIFILSIISIITINSALTYTSSSLGNLALKQAIWYGVGWLFVILLVKLNNEYLFQHTWILYIIGNILLLLLLFFGTPINNSRCWFTIPGIGSFQPSEFMKIFIMLALATMIHNFRSDYDNPTIIEEFIFLIKSFVIVLIPSILTFLQPDTGAVLIYLIIYISMMFVSGIRLGWFGGAFLGMSLLIGGVLWLYFFKENTLPVIRQEKVNKVIYESNATYLPVIYGGKKVTYLNEEQSKNFDFSTLQNATEVQGEEYTATTTNNEIYQTGGEEYNQTFQTGGIEINQAFQTGGEYNQTFQTGGEVYTENTFGQNYTETTQENYDNLLGNITTQATTETFVENTQPAQIDYGKINPIEQGLGFEEYKKTNY